MLHSGFHYSEYTCTRSDVIDLMIRHFPLALIVSEQNQQIFGSHIPLFRHQQGRGLFGHVDRRNQQFPGLASFAARLVFTGPQRYIPPEVYSSQSLPTWNYVAVHIDCTVTVIDDLATSLEILRETASRLQAANSPFQFNSREPRIAAAAPHILTLEIESHFEEGRFKLSQDKSVQDQEAALAWLLDTDTSALRQMMLLLKDATHHYGVND